jgi:Zn-dependent oligopeptidase
MTPEIFLNKLNKEYNKLHTNYENLFWLSYMGDKSATKKMDIAKNKRDAFRSDAKLYRTTEELINKAKGENKKRLQYWLTFFKKYHIPNEALNLKKEITALESKIQTIRSKRIEGYLDPKSLKFIKVSELGMRSILRNNENEDVRRACFEAMEELPNDTLPLYIELIEIRNKFAKLNGFNDFYAYKLYTEEGMKKDYLFNLFDGIYQNTKYAFNNIRNLEKTRPSLRKHWNFAYMFSSDFAKEEDQYFQFEDSLLSWGQTFYRLGVDYQGSKLKLDLLDRKGKYSNGFCHWPNLVRYDGDKLIPGSSNFTCNVVLGSISGGSIGLHTLFHEGGHAAHLLNSRQKDACVNHEYPPASTAWDETQSMFMDSISSSIEWKTRYANNSRGDLYPFSLFERKLEKLHVLAPLDFMSIMYVSEFEKRIYEEKSLDINKVKTIARLVNKKYFDRSTESVSVLNVPHIYSFESSASYHGYGLALLAVAMWRDYFYKKYGHIVDNKKVGLEMKKVWSLAHTKSFNELVKIATGQELSPKSYIKSINRSIEEIKKISLERIDKLKGIKNKDSRLNLNAQISLYHGKKKITDNKNGFEKMAEKYSKWLKSQ